MTDTTPPQSARSGCQLPQRWSRGHFVPDAFVDSPISERYYTSRFSTRYTKSMSRPPRTASASLSYCSCL